MELDAAAVAAAFFIDTAAHWSGLEEAEKLIAYAAHIQMRPMPIVERFSVRDR